MKLKTFIFSLVMSSAFILPSQADSFTVKEEQGKLQGILVSLTNATGVIGPLLFSFIFGQTLATWDGWVWLIGAMMYVLLIAFILSFHRSSSQIVKITKLPES